MEKFNKFLELKFAFSKVNYSSHFLKLQEYTGYKQSAVEHTKSPIQNLIDLLF